MGVVVFCLFVAIDLVRWRTTADRGSLWLAVSMSGLGIVCASLAALFIWAPPTAGPLDVPGAIVAGVYIGGALLVVGMVHQAIGVGEQPPADWPSRRFPCLVGKQRGQQFDSVGDQLVSILVGQPVQGNRLDESMQAGGVVHIRSEQSGLVQRPQHLPAAQRITPGPGRG